MRSGFRKYFVAIWVAAVIFFLYELSIGFSASWLIKPLSYFYVASLVFLFIEPGFISERMGSSERFIDLKGHDIGGVLLLVFGGTALLLFIGSKSSVILIFSIVSFFASIWVILKYKILITKHLIVKGLIIGGLCSLAQYNYLPSLLAILLVAPFLYIAGSLINEKFSLTDIHFNRGSYSRSFKSILIGGIYALPMALANLSDVIATNPYTWLKQVWQPLLAFNFVLLEETFMRLFLMSFIFALISAKTEKKAIPVVASVIISSTVFGFSHYPNIDYQNCLNIAVLYGLPLGVLFYKRDFETVLGYHFIINFISAVSTYVYLN